MPLPISLLHISIVVVLVACSALIHTSRPAITPDQICVSRDLANPIASLFPNNATGVLNATLAIIPIPLETARRLIPLQYGILEHAYRSILPNFPEGMYPVLLQAAHDHDVQLKAFGITLEDFSRIGLEFPFVDLLGDGHSSFRWAPAQLITADHDIALQGSMAYGTKVSPAAFQPPCDAYQRLPSGAPSGAATSFRATSASTGEYAEVQVSRLPAGSAASPYSIEAFKNITNQPTFANASTCDNMIRLFNSSMSRGEYEPVFVRGRVRANVAPLEEAAEWSDVYGVQVATPFVENNYLDCRSMRGYAGTGGGGDSTIDSRSNDNYGL
ncbi:hypothetical protein CONLIGDRAFT_681011 [Coniochaeta ligniaria NRRL 30616]|uniref:Uncharacterized protein n=1 Tax=Coniochaeta ligniaria NRRL 30616 TaxID=1408157 RepID=A0A1J7IST6_9PEZI|nr:hypothetical protein CONLIGDRAFT_681011 [Coniochaeta ligniaria NRRL 30616]